MTQQPVYIQIPYILVNNALKYEDLSSDDSKLVLLTRQLQNP